MAFDPALLSHLCELARLALSEQDQRELRRDLERIVEAVAVLGELDLEGVEPLRHGCEIEARWREDVLEPGLAREVALAQAPQAQAGGFVVPRVVEGGS